MRALLLLAPCHNGTESPRLPVVLLIMLACAILGALTTVTSSASAGPPAQPFATASEDLQPTAPSKTGLSPDGAAALVEHLLAVVNRQWSVPVDSQGQPQSAAEIERASIWAYRGGLMQQWRLQIDVAGDTLDIDDSRNPPQVRYRRGPYLRISGDHDPGYVAGRRDAQDLVRDWVAAIEAEVAEEREAILSRSEDGRIDYRAIPQLEALRYLRSRLRSQEFDRLNFEPSREHGMSEVQQVESGDSALPCQRTPAFFLPSSQPREKVR